MKPLFVCEAWGLFEPVAKCIYLGAYILRHVTRKLVVPNIGMLICLYTEN